MAAVEKNLDLGRSDTSDVETKRMYHDVVKETGSHGLGSTASDVEDMDRMGKPQQFKVSCYGNLVVNQYLLLCQRIFRLSSMIMLTSMVQGTWEAVLVYECDISSLYRAKDSSIVQCKLWRNAERWPCWSLLGLHLDLHRIFHHCHVPR
jgi:hypothetical protein